MGYIKEERGTLEIGRQQTVDSVEVIPSSSRLLPTAYFPAVLRKITKKC